MAGISHFAERLNLADRVIEVSIKIAGSGAIVRGIDRKASMRLICRKRHETQIGAAL